jgi:hypothetical protein
MSESSSSASTERKGPFIPKDIGAHKHTAEDHGAREVVNEVEESEMQEKGTRAVHGPGFIHSIQRSTS